jgi:hypothetical protein
MARRVSDHIPFGTGEVVLIAAASCSPGDRADLKGQRQCTGPAKLRLGQGLRGPIDSVPPAVDLVVARLDSRRSPHPGNLTRRSAIDEQPKGWTTTAATASSGRAVLCVILQRRPNAYPAIVRSDRYGSPQGFLGRKPVCRSGTC